MVTPGTENVGQCLPNFLIVKVQGANKFHEHVSSRVKGPTNQLDVAPQFFWFEGDLKRGLFLRLESIDKMLLVLLTQMSRNYLGK